jgi:hypothetical protein
MARYVCGCYLLLLASLSSFLSGPNWLAVYALVPKIQPFWDHEKIQTSLAVEGLEQFRSLLDKLYRGQPIVTYALGSSVTDTFGGCYSDKSIEKIRKMRPHMPACEAWVRSFAWFLSFAWFFVY